MASYQDIESRLRSVEDRLTFVMRTFRMKAMIGTGIVNADGTPRGRMFDASLEELYHLANSKNLDVEVKQLHDSAPVEAEVATNGN